MALPLLAAAAGGSKLLGGVLGAFGQNAMLDSGLRQAKNLVGQGTQTLEAGRTGTDTAFQPYTSTGATAAQGQLDAIQNRQMATQPTLTNTSASGVQAWLSPQATWTQNQATKAATAAGVATGATGGGMQRAISADADKRALSNWNDAYKAMLEANAQNFGQQQQQFTNQTGFDQSQIENLGAVANRGVGAVGTNQQLDYNYNTGINQNYGNLADKVLGIKSAQGQLFNNTATNTGNNLAGLFSQITPRTGG